MEDNMIIETTATEVVDAPAVTDGTGSPVMDTIIDEDNLDVFKALSMKAQVNDMAKLCDNIRGKQDIYMENPDEDAAIVDERLAQYTVDQIKAMSDDELDKMFITDDGREINLIPPDTDVDMHKFKRNYAIYRKDSNEALKNLDEEIEKFQKEMEESEEEIAQILNQFNDMDEFIRDQLHKKIEAATDPKKVELYESLLQAMDYAFSLDNVVEFYSNDYRRRMVIPNYKDDKRSMGLFRRYKKVVEEVGFRTDLTKYVKLEKKFLPEKYHERDNLFLFAIINMASTWAKCDDNRMNGLFLTQFSVNLKNMIYDKFADKDARQKFIDNICKVLDIFID